MDIEVKKNDLSGEYEFESKSRNLILDTYIR